MDRCPTCHRLYKAPRGVFTCVCAKSEEPSVPVRQPVFPEGEGVRTYVVSDFRRTCARCTSKNSCSRDPKTCDYVSFFPLPHYVSLTFADGKIIRSSCTEGRRPGGPPCRQEDCRHIGRALDRMVGVSHDNGVETSLITGASTSVPKCPNCREKWGVTATADGKFECRNPTCCRDGRSWVFEAGSNKRPAPMRNELVVRDRDGGREVVKRESHKRFGSL